MNTSDGVLLSEVAEVFNGKTPSKADQRDRGHPVLKIRDVDEAGFFRGRFDSFVDDSLAAKHPTKAIARGDTLILNAAHNADYVGSKQFFARADVEGAMATGEWLIVRAHQRTLDPRYLHFWLTAPATLSELRELVKGIHLYPKDVGRLSLQRLPPLGEQQRIADILERADALLQKRKRSIALLDALTRSTFLQMFGDPKSNPNRLPTRFLGDVADFYAGNSLPEGEKFDGQKDGYLMLKVSDMNAPGNEEIIGTSALWRQSPGSKAGTCPAKSIVFPKRGGAIGTNKKRLLARPAILDPNVMAVAARDGLIETGYLFQWFQAFNLADITSGSSVPQLNKGDLAPLEIALPSLKLQQAFVFRRERISSAKSAMLKAAVALESLFHSLRDRGFAGELQ